MPKGLKIIFFSWSGLLLIGGFAFSQEDAKGCKDHPFLSRMPGYYLAECKTTSFDTFDFFDPDSQGKKKTTVEGKKFWIRYYVKKESYDNHPSALQIIRNHENAIKKIGGQTYSWTQIGGGELHARMIKDGQELWARLFINENGRGYMLTMIEKGEMKQEVVADAKTMAADIGTSGKTAIYGIYFDFNKAEVKAESDPALKEIAQLLAQNPKWKVYVVGHTDNVGGFDYNMKLSLQRAEAVVKELVSKYKVEASRLKALGLGPAAPVNSNDTEEGKAKNRRVELVKQ